VNDLPSCRRESSAPFVWQWDLEEAGVTPTLGSIPLVVSAFAIASLVKCFAMRISVMIPVQDYNITIIEPARK